MKNKVTELLANWTLRNDRTSRFSTLNKQHCCKKIKYCFLNPYALLLQILITSESLQIEASSYDPNEKTFFSLLYNFCAFFMLYSNNACFSKPKRKDFSLCSKVCKLLQIEMGYLKQVMGP